MGGALRQVGTWTLEIVRRCDQAGGLVVLPWRWVVERTFAWLGRNRRLAKDIKDSAVTARARLYAASVKLLIRRIASA